MMFSCVRLSGARGAYGGALALPEGAYVVASQYMTFTNNYVEATGDAASTMEVEAMVSE